MNMKEKILEAGSRHVVKAQVLAVVCFLAAWAGGYFAIASVEASPFQQLLIGVLFFFIALWVVATKSAYDGLDIFIHVLAGEIDDIKRELAGLRDDLSRQ